jgi:subtilisin family serine protease
MSDELKPAWSWQFDDNVLAAAVPLSLPEPLTAEWAWGGGKGQGVKVAIIDSGIDAAHPAVGEVNGYAALAWNADNESVEVDENPHEDLFGHGTACAGIIRSLAPNVAVYSIRVLGADLRGKSLVFAEGIRWAVDHGMDVINMSLSTGNRDYFDMFHELADHAYFHNSILVCAANNVEGPSYPSTYASVFSVAAHANKDPFAFEYNPNPPVEFGAPGIDLDIAWLDGGTIEATGNSFAAPHIAGVVALVLGKHPGLAPFQVKTILRELAANARR